MPRKTKVRTATKTKARFWYRHRYLKRLLIGLAVLAGLIVLWMFITDVRSVLRQSRLQPFYRTKDLTAQGQPGQIVRQEPLGMAVEGGQGVRMLYRTERADGSPTFSSGMVFIPDNDNAGLPRPVVAWAHGTLGLGDACAPSRTADPLDNIGWISSMLQKGWVVTASDYAGFGTAGTQGYLVGSAEAHDVLNSVRAARNLGQTKAGSTFIIYGHSQGGNAALFSANQAAAYAPELRLAGTIAAAPAAELVALLNGQYGNKVADWVIGPLIVTSWPAANKDLHADDVLTAEGRDNYRRVANQCIGQAFFTGLIRNVLDQQFFSRNPVDVPAWRAMAKQQSAPVLGTGQPLMVVESKTDQVVLPDTTALYIQESCRTNPAVSTLWLEKASHQDIPTDSATQVIGWIGDRLAGKPQASSCNQPLPFKPATVPPLKN